MGDSTHPSINERTSVIGILNPMFPTSDAAELIPSTSPVFLSNRGPPLFPGAIGADIWYIFNDKVVNLNLYQFH